MTDLARKASGKVAIPRERNAESQREGRGGRQAAGVRRDGRGRPGEEGPFKITVQRK